VTSLSAFLGEKYSCHERTYNHNHTQSRPRPHASWKRREKPSPSPTRNFSASNLICYQPDAPKDGFVHLAAQTHDISFIGEHIPNISTLAADLKEAVQAAWPHCHDIRYTKVEALLLRWADDDLGVRTELKGL
jgi:hypothetical protein